MADKKLQDTKEGFGISGFTLGIVSIALAGSLGMLLSIVGFVFCRMQQKKNPTRLGKTGIILNIIAFILSILLLFLIAPLLQEQLQGLY